MHACKCVKVRFEFNRLVRGYFLVDQLDHFSMFTFPFAAFACIGFNVLLKQFNQVFVKEWVAVLELSRSQDHFYEIPKHQDVVLVVHIIPHRHFVLQIVHVFNSV